ncbi:MAG: diaminopimelate epimerase [Candidatus Omnitrophica bacterium CG11_big_fil_rev_8_21_14_0_20_64_10]|nr:MAG: diaminopimelate epimerase [Candidatus Omnitrophica bacterium CG11_big_fil_rev_8_21_14_0_20_64_10]
MGAPKSFLKVVGSGNDFILFDARKQPVTNPTAARWARRWCDRHRGVGADGLLLVLPSRKGLAKMRIFNADGSAAEMCGNGLRCVAWYLHTTNRGARNFRVETDAGLMGAQITGNEKIRIHFPEPSRLRLRQKLTVRNTELVVHSVNTGVPHAIVLVPNLNRSNLMAVAPGIRFHRAFGARGTNVDFVQVLSPKRIAIRTYERGVEGETLACGTGAVASAAIATALKRTQPPVQVKTASGETLTVGLERRGGGSGPRAFHRNGHGTFQVWLEGPARILFKGELKG